MKTTNGRIINIKYWRLEMFYFVVRNRENINRYCKIMSLHHAFTLTRQHHHNMTHARIYFRVSRLVEADRAAIYYTRRDAE